MTADITLSALMSIVGGLPWSTPVPACCILFAGR